MTSTNGCNDGVCIDALVVMTSCMQATKLRGKLVEQKIPEEAVGDFPPHPGD